ncbi:DNA utilization family protein [Samsonia erythrinae]|uniref:Pilus assembly protein HofP n=1 Tax=Samsonia erythrinae TaxID=160434 RepID=A0A4R3VMP9_9GAMM|nr:DNA utilization family protein [Samsonia erythrinae]TCV05176.1 pilus assembly protein HofP [Samsonia erythrinae]
MKKTMFHILLMLLLAPHSAHAEKAVARIDPFQPVEALRCPLSKVLPQWQLKGVIGSGDQWAGWLTLPEIGWLQLKNGAAIPPGHWLVHHVDKSGARLVPATRAEGCHGLSAVQLPSPFINSLAE